MGFGIWVCGKMGAVFLVVRLGWEQAFLVGGFLSVCFYLLGVFGGGGCWFTLVFLREGSMCVFFAETKHVEGIRGEDFT